MKVFQKNALTFLFVSINALMFSSCYAQKQIIIDIGTRGISPGTDADIAPQLQNIINKAAPGSVIYLPAGKYIMDGPVNIKTNNLTLKGENNTKLVFTNKTDYYQKYNQRVGMINIGANNIVIDNLYLDQNFRGSGRKCGEMPLIAGILSGCSYLGKSITTNNTTIRNCTVYDYYGDAISVFHSSTTNYTVNNCHLVSAFIAGNWSECAHKGEQGINIAAGSDITITGNNIEGAIDDAIATHGNCSNINISNNTISTIRGRIFIDGVTNGIVKNNTIEYLRSGWAGIMLTMAPDTKAPSSSNNVTVEGNIIHINKGVTVATAIMLYAPGTNIIIKGNTINSDDPQNAAGIQLAERLINKTTKTYYFGDKLSITNNNINNFSNGIKFNITSKVKEPAVDINDNNITNHKEKITRESSPFVLKLQDNTENN